MKKHLIISSLVALSAVIASNASAQILTTDGGDTVNVTGLSLGDTNGLISALNGKLDASAAAETYATQTSLTALQTAVNNLDTGVMSVATGSTAGTISVDGTDIAVNGVLTDATAFATAAQGALAETAIQSIATGSTAGTISVDGTDIAVNGVLTDATAFATAAQGTLAETAIQSIAAGSTNGTISVDGGSDIVVYDDSALNTAIGTLSNLTTTDQSSLVNAINEVAVIANAPARELYTVDLNTNPGSGNLSGTSFINDLYALDSAIGNRSQLSNTRHANAPTVTDAIVSLDTQVALNEDNIEINRQNIAQNRADIDANTQRISNLSDAVSALDTNLNHIDQRIDKVENNLKSGLAAVTALTALVPNARDCGDTQLSVGAGMYSNRAGVAFGGFHYLNDHILLNAGASFGGAKDLAFRAGITFGL